MSEMFTFMGWTFPQWRYAIERHNRLNPDTPMLKKVHEIPLDVIDNRLLQWQDLQSWWKANFALPPAEGDVLIRADDDKQLPPALRAGADYERQHGVDWRRADDMRAEHDAEMRRDAFGLP